MNLDLGSCGDKENAFVKFKSYPLDQDMVALEDRTRSMQEPPIDEYLAAMLGLNHPKNKFRTATDEIGMPLMISTSGTSKTSRDEAIMSFESILPSVLDNLKANRGGECIDSSMLNERLLFLAKKAPSDILASLTIGEIERRVERILALENAISAFDELSPEQKKTLDE